MKKTVTQNDLHKRLFLLLMGQPTKNGNVFMGEGVGKLHPLFLLHSKRETHFVKPHLFSAHVLEQYSPAIELYT